MVHKVRKRDGDVVLFDKDKIAEAIWKSVKAVGGHDKDKAKYISELVVKKLNDKFGEKAIPEVEAVQDLVEKILIEEGHAKTAKAYILYRKSHDELRTVKGLFDTIEAVEEVIQVLDDDSNLSQGTIHKLEHLKTKYIFYKK